MDDVYKILGSLFLGAIFTAVIGGGLVFGISLVNAVGPLIAGSVLVVFILNCVIAHYALHVKEW